jgi:hypothetical protein
MDKGTAQGKRFSRRDRVTSDCPYNGFRSKGSILEVGGAYLFKKPRSKARKIPRFRISQTTTTVIVALIMP